MANFVTDNTPLPPLKSDANPPVRPEIEVDAADINGLWAALGDVRTALATEQPVNFVAPFTGAVSRAIPSKLSEIVSVKDFGAVCDGATDDTAAIQAMLTGLGAAFVTLVVPGPCKVTANITIPASIHVRLDGNGGFVGSGIVTYSSWGETGQVPPTVRRLSGTQAVDFTWGTFGASPNRNATGAAVAFDSTKLATKVLWTSALQNQYTGVVADGTFDLSASSTFAIDVGFDTASVNTQITVILSSDATLSTYANYALVNLSPPKLLRYSMQWLKSAMTISNAPNWSAIKHIEVRFQRTASATIDANALYIYGFWQGVSSRPKVLLTFDDGYASTYTVAYPYMKSAGMRGTLYINGSFIDSTTIYMTLDQLRDAYANGWDVGNHTWDHTILTGDPRLGLGTQITSGQYTRVGTTATLTVANHGYAVGNVITLAGSDESEYNGTRTIATVPDANTMTFPTAGTNSDTTARGYSYIQGWRAQEWVTAEFRRNREWLAARNLTRGIDHVAYPYGAYDQDVIATVTGLGAKTGRLAGTYWAPAAPFWTLTGELYPYVLPSYVLGPTTTAALALAQIDTAIANGQTVILLGHQFVTSAPGTNQMLTSEFQALIDGLKTRRDSGSVDVVTITEWFNRL